jgi:hypothetical protein
VTLRKAFVVLCLIAPLMHVCLQAQMRPTRGPAATAQEAPRGVVYAVEADGKRMGTFQKVAFAAALPLQTQGRQSGATSKKPGKMILSDGDQTSLQAFEIWNQQTTEGKPGTGRRTVTITGTDTSGKVVAHYKLTNAFPSKLSLSPLYVGKVKTSSITVELEYEQVQMN